MEDDSHQQAAEATTTTIDGKPKSTKKKKAKRRSKSVVSKEKSKKSSKSKSSSVTIEDDDNDLKAEIDQVIKDINKTVNLESRLEEEVQKNKELSQTVKRLESQLSNLDEETSPTKKREKLKFLGGPEEFLAECRENLSKHLISEQEEEYSRQNITYYVQSIQALLTFNSEIFERCEDSLQISSKGKFRVSVTRFGFGKVKAYKSADGKKITFAISGERSTKTFDAEPLMKLPDKLTNIFEPIYDDSEFLDLEKYFMKSLGLHEDVLRPFLALFKTHLEQVQVSLGKIDSWIMGPAIICDYIERTFYKQLGLPDEDTVDKASKLTRCIGPGCRYMHFDVCLSCNETFNMHNSNGIFKCPNGKTRPTFKHRPYQIIATYDANDTGSFDKDFDVEDEMDQIRLQKFLEFISL